MHIHLISLFPERLQTYFSQGVFRRAEAMSLFALHYHQLRDHSTLKHAQVDDHPFGGKHGMLLRADIAAQAICAVPDYETLPVFVPCPKGPLLTHTEIQTLSQGRGFIVLSPAYEGIDERLYDLLPIRRFSCGEYVLTSGDLPALLLCDAVLRLVPGVLGNPDCRHTDSIASGFLEHPQFTQPRQIPLGDQLLSVPDILCSGHHHAISQWKWVESLKATLYYRPDLLLAAQVDTALQKTCYRDY